MTTASRVGPPESAHDVNSRPVHLYATWRWLRCQKKERKLRRVAGGGKRAIPSFPNSCLGTHVRETPVSPPLLNLRASPGVERCRNRSFGGGRSQTGVWERGQIQGPVEGVWFSD